MDKMMMPYKRLSSSPSTDHLYPLTELQMRPFHLHREYNSFGGRGMSGLAALLPSLPHHQERHQHSSSRRAMLLERGRLQQQQRQQQQRQQHSAHVVVQARAPDPPGDHWEEATVYDNDDGKGPNTTAAALLPTQKQCSVVPHPLRPKRRRVMPEPRSFIDTYEALVDFKKRFGHVDVPQRWKEDPRLGRWVKNIRQKSERLSKKERKLLEELGLQWRMRK